MNILPKILASEEKATTMTVNTNNYRQVRPLLQHTSLQTAQTTATTHITTNSSDCCCNTHCKQFRLML